MKRKTLLESIVIFLTTTIVLSCYLNPASATITVIDHQNANGSTIINLDGHPQIKIDAWHNDWGDFGIGNTIRVSYYTGIVSNPYFIVAYFTDNPSKVGFYQELIGPAYPVVVKSVDPGAIMVSREGNSKTIMVSWKISLEVPEENWGGPAHIVIPAFMVPTGRIILRGYGDVSTGTTTVIPNSAVGQTWSQLSVFERYNAIATFVCPAWQQGGPVGDATTNIRTETTVISTK